VATILDAILADAAVHRAVLAHWIESGRLLRENPTHELVACLRAGSDGDIDAAALGRHIATACTGAMHQWSAGIVEGAELRARCGLAVDVAFAAAGDARAAKRLR
jgi:hypothetical protein